MTNQNPATDFRFPTTEVAVEADRLVARVAPEYIYNHSIRSYVFASAAATAGGLRPDVDFDDELVYLSCLLHDLGATTYANGGQRFEVDGADAASAFLNRFGVADERIRTVWNAIALHTSEGIAHRFGTEVAVAQAGIALDILGRGKEDLPDGFADRVHAAWPRRDVGYALANAIAEQVAAKPVKAAGPLSFPGHVYRLHYPSAEPSTWFELVEAAGWGDRPDPQMPCDSSDSM